MPVNPLLADPLYLNKYIEKAGSGTLDIFDLCRKAKLDKPEFKMKSGCFVVTLWRKNKAISKIETTQKTSQKQQEILDYLKKYSKASREEIAENIKSITESGVKYNLKVLQDKGLLKRIGSPKGGHWEVVES